MFYTTSPRMPGTGFKLKFSLGTNPPLSIESIPFNVEDPCAVHISVRASNISVAGEAMLITANALDFDLQVRTRFMQMATVSWQIGCVSCESAILQGTTEVLATNGVARFSDLSVTVANAYNILQEILRTRLWIRPCLLYTDQCQSLFLKAIFIPGLNSQCRSVCEISTRPAGLRCCSWDLRQ